MIPVFMEDLLTMLEGKQTKEQRLAALYEWILNDGTVLSDTEYILVTEFCESLDRTQLIAFYNGEI